MTGSDRREEGRANEFFGASDATLRVRLSKLEAELMRSSLSAEAHLRVIERIEAVEGELARRAKATP